RHTRFSRDWSSDVCSSDLELERRYPTDMSAPHGLPEALRTRTVQWASDIEDELLVAGTRDEEHLRLARELGLRSFVVAPIVIERSEERRVGKECGCSTVAV